MHAVDTFPCRTSTCLQPTLVHALLAVLPPTVRQLYFEVDCRGPLFNILRRFTQLESIAICSTEGNGARLQWSGGAAAAAVPKLPELRLIFRQEPEWQGDGWVQAVLAAVPSSLPYAAAAATRLSSLELMCEWRPTVALLCATLPALEDLRCGVSPAGLHCSATH